MLGLGLIIQAGQRVLGGLNALIKTLTGRATYSENTADSNAVVEALDTAGILDDATILLTPTAYSDARVHSVKTYTGDELVTDGSFENGLSDWDSNSNVSIVDGAARFNNIGLSGANAYLIKNSILEAGKTYKFECDVISTNGKGLVLEQSSPGNASIGTTTIGHKIIYFTQGTETYLTIKRVDSETDVTIDNISVTEADADFDFDRASSATRINSSANIEDITSDLARINYDSNGDNGHILLEPTSTNFITYSEDFSESVWSKVDVLIDGGYTAPDGSNTAYKVTKNGSNAHLVGFNNQNTSRHKSIWAKTVSGTGDVYLLNQNTNNLFSLTNEWQRFDVAHTGANWFYAVDFRSSALTEVIVWGAQLEALPYATSYIPNHGTAVGVTRAAETLTGSGNSTLINTTQGTIYLESKLGGTTGTKLFSIGGGTNNADPAITIGYTGQNMYMDIVDSGSLISTSGDRTISGINVSSYNKMAIKYTTTNVTVYLNGVQKHTETIDFTPATNVLKTLYAGYGTGSIFEGQIKVLAVFDRALESEELTDLTTL